MLPSLSSASSHHGIFHRHGIVVVVVSLSSLSCHCHCPLTVTFAMCMALLVTLLCWCHHCVIVGCIIDTAAGCAGVVVIASSPSLLCIHGHRCCCLHAGMDTLRSSSWPCRPCWLLSHGHGCVVDTAAGCHNVHECGGRVIAIVIDTSGGGGHVTWSSVSHCCHVHACIRVPPWYCG